MAERRGFIISKTTIPPASKTIWETVYIDNVPMPQQQVINYPECYVLITVSGDDTCQCYSEKALFESVKSGDTVILPRMQGGFCKHN